MTQLILSSIINIEDKNKIESEYINIKDNLQKQKDKLKNLEEEKDKHPTKDWSIIMFKFIFPTTLLIISSLFIFGWSLSQIVEFLTPYTNLNEHAIMFLTALVGVTAIPLIEGTPAIILTRVLIRRTIKKNIDSQEYQDILKEIENLKQEIEQTKDKLINKETELKKIDNEYTCNSEEISMRRALINYITSETNTTTFKSPEKTKTRKRELIKSNNQVQE